MEDHMKCRVSIELRAGDVLVAVSEDPALFGQVYQAVMGIKPACALCYQVPTAYCCNNQKEKPQCPTP